MNNTTDLFEINWMELFNVWVLPINLCCNNASTNKSSEEFIKLKMVLPEVLSDESVLCSKIWRSFKKNKILYRYLNQNERYLSQR